MKKNGSSFCEKVVGEEEAVNLVEACLDGWLRPGDIIKSLKNLCQNF